MPFTGILMIGLLAMVCGGVWMAATRRRKAATVLLVTGLVILVASLVLIKLATDFM